MTLTPAQQAEAQQQHDDAKERCCAHYGIPITALPGQYDSPAHMDVAARLAIQKGTVTRPSPAEKPNPKPQTAPDPVAPTPAEELAALKADLEKLQTTANQLAEVEAADAQHRQEVLKLMREEVAELHAQGKHHEARLLTLRAAARDPSKVRR